MGTGYGYGYQQGYAQGYNHPNPGTQRFEAQQQQAQQQYYSSPIHGQVVSTHAYPYSQMMPMQTMQQPVHQSWIQHAPMLLAPSHLMQSSPSFPPQFPPQQMNPSHGLLGIDSTPQMQNAPAMFVPATPVYSQSPPARQRQGNSARNPIDLDIPQRGNDITVKREATRDFVLTTSTTAKINEEQDLWKATSTAEVYITFPHVDGDDMAQDDPITASEVKLVDEATRAEIIIPEKEIVKTRSDLLTWKKAKTAPTFIPMCYNCHEATHYSNQCDKQETPAKRSRLG